MGAQANGPAGRVPVGGVYYRRPFSDLKRARPFLNESTHRPELPVIIPRAEHPISRSHIASSALKVLYRLKDAGYQAFLVGGCVRDIAIGLQPKDFDVATDASPDEVRALFRSCRLIGRRFRLAHVRFGSHIIEVATFRAAQEPGDDEDAEEERQGIVDDADPEDDDEFGEDEDEGEGEDEEEGEDEDEDDGPVRVEARPSRNPDGQRVLNERGRVLRDNLYGTIDQDVWRRDFTCNGLYYNIADFSIWDYVGGVADVRSRTLRLIGDPDTRYREDPVRMLRAVRFQAKLGFTMDPATRDPIPRLAGLLDGIPPARLFDEFQKLFLTGFARRACDLLVEHGLFEHLFPATAAQLESDADGMFGRLLRAGLDATDQRVADGRAVTPMFLFAVLLFGPVSVRAQRRFEGGMKASQAIAESCDEVMRQQAQRIGLPKRFSIPMREMLALQPRFHQRAGRRGLGFLSHPRFRAAYDFLLLRVEAGGEDPAIGQWWTEIQELPQDERLARAEALRPEPRQDGAKRKRRRRGGRGRRKAPPPQD